MSFHPSLHRIIVVRNSRYLVVTSNQLSAANPIPTSFHPQTLTLLNSLVLTLQHPAYTYVPSTASTGTQHLEYTHRPRSRAIPSHWPYNCRPLHNPYNTALHPIAILSHQAHHWSKCPPKPTQRIPPPTHSIYNDKNSWSKLSVKYSTHPTGNAGRYLDKRQQPKTQPQQKKQR